MQESIREGWVKHHREPVNRNNLTVDDFIPLRGLHPAVGSEDPEGRDDRTQGYHAGGKKVEAWPDAVPAE